MNNLRHAFRTLVKSPGFSAVALLSLAFGIGVNTTIFSVVNAVLLRPLPVDRPGEIVEIYTSTDRKEFPQSVFSYPDYVDLRAGNEVFSGVAAHAMAVASLRRQDEEPKTVMAEVVSDDFFDVMGVPMLLGRSFAPDEGVTEGTHPVVILGNGFWKSEFAADPRIVGKQVHINTVAFTVIGVAPASFTGMLPAVKPQVWIPLMMSDSVSLIGINDEEESPIGNTRLERRGSRFLFVKGRLAEGVTLEQAQANASTLMARLEQEYPQTNEDRGATLMPASSVRIFPMIDEVLTPVAGLLQGIVGLVLLIACANIANMLLARSSARRREVAVRLALGAGRGALIRGLLAESLLLAGAGGGLGLLFSIWATRLLGRLPVMGQMSLDIDMGVDVRVLAFVFGVTLATGIAFGLGPALRASRPDLVSALKEGEAAEAGGRHGFGMRDALVVAQVAVSLLLLVGAGLLLRSLRGAQDIDLGFDADSTAMIEMQLDMLGYEDEQADAFQREYLDRVRALPQVEAAALTQKLPLTADVSITGIFIPELHETEDDELLADEAVVGPGYFDTLRVALVQGRDFAESDAPDTPLVAIVNETMARTFWPRQNVIGRRFRTGIDGAEYEIVGVVADHKVRTLGEEPRPLVHLARTQTRSTYAIVVARSAGDTGALVQALRDELEAMAPELNSGPSSVRETVEVTLLPVMLGAQMLAGFGMLATLLAAIGLYGVIAYSVSRRIREIGIRIALGADRLGVIKLVVRRGMALAAIGVGIGSLAAGAMSGLLGGFLYGIRALDPLSFAGAASLLLGVAFLANYLPARRAARVDPLVALRSH